MFRVPDLLRPDPRTDVDRDALAELLELAFLGREVGGKLDGTLAGGADDPPGWDSDLFARDLFLADLVRDVVRVEIGGERKSLHADHLLRVLGAPPTDETTILFRQDILRELLERRELRRRFEDLYLGLGGNTRLLQTIGLCQVLGQSGLPVPAAEAVLPRVRGLFVSLIETEAFDEGEGRPSIASARSASSAPTSSTTRGSSWRIRRSRACSSSRSRSTSTSGRPTASSPAWRRRRWRRSPPRGWGSRSRPWRS